MAAHIDLTNVRVIDLEASKQALDSVTDGEAKFKIFDELTTKELKSVAFAALNTLGKDPNFNPGPKLTLGPMGPTYVERIVDVVDKSDLLSKHMLKTIDSTGSARLWTVCHQLDTYIHTKLFHALDRLINAKNFVGNQKADHPLHALNILYWKLQLHNHGLHCPCFNHIETELSDKVADSFASQGAKTCIIVKYDAGFGNTLHIRGEGEGSNLSWGKGIALENIDSDTWVFKTNSQFTNLKYKIVLNDQFYETGENRVINHGKNDEVRPKF